MATIQLELDDDLVHILDELNQPVEQAIREMIVIDLYRRELISAGKGAELLGWPLKEFIQHTGKLGIPFFRQTPEELDRELELLRSLEPRTRHR